ncbi:MAG: alpha mannosidase-like protein [Peltula sp. TS41687]|nr:MAG: alpha mannosidase-like protein [Peltula sp. TS41687]
MAVSAMRKAQLEALKQETMDMFYHGYDHYMKIAFPEDELRPLTCVPLTRDQEHPENIGLNDVLGNYSLTLIDSLSTLAVLASSSQPSHHHKPAFEQFQHGVQSLVEHYGDGTEGPAGQGIRGRGFDVDSKVQVFETVIRGVGGLLSAHLFAVGDLPVRGYTPFGRQPHYKANRMISDSERVIDWPNGFRYNGQLLRLALDLGKRLLPAFTSPTGLPYPRVNLKYGIPFYANSAANTEKAECRVDQSGRMEITETCSAGAGSLILEFTTLSRLTGDPRFETLAKRAFWEVWNRRSSIGLIGAGIDAESGLWTSATTGVGAGVDSFFEYALKSYILLSGQRRLNGTLAHTVPNSPHLSIEDGEDSPNAFLEVWQTAHTAIKRHLYRDLHHPHYVNSHFRTGSPMAPWIDSLSAYYPGLLTLGGELDEAIETNLLYTALWSRYAALPERWSISDGGVEGGLGWWPGRPELIESTYHLYRATKDPWYLHVGEMILKDIKRRCWTECGWAGLQDVRTGELADRMESFFLGETIKYMFLLFDTDHPLNTLDAPYVLSTEGHPLILNNRIPSLPIRRHRDHHVGNNDATCPAAPPSIPLTVSGTAARDDIYHAAGLARLHLIPAATSFDRLSETGTDGIASSSISTSQTHAVFPWTLPLNLIPSNGTCSKIRTRYSFELQFPFAQPNELLGQQSVSRVAEGILINSLGGLKLGIIRDESQYREDERSEQGVRLRIQSVGGLPLGRDERVLIKKDAFRNVVDPNFLMVHDPTISDLLIELRDKWAPVRHRADRHNDHAEAAGWAQSILDGDFHGHKLTGRNILDPRDILNMVLQRFGHATDAASEEPRTLQADYHQLLAVSATGIGACPLPETWDVPEVNDPSQKSGTLPWKTIYFSDETCQGKLPDIASTGHQIIVIQRGECSFSQKLSRIPIFRPSKRSLQLVVVVSNDEGGIRPLLDDIQYTPAGLVRYHQIPMVMVGGGQETNKLLGKAKGVGIRKRYHVQSQGVPISNLKVI